MSSESNFLLAYLPKEILCSICEGLPTIDIAHLYGTNCKLLQRKLVSPGCVPNCFVTAIYEPLDESIRMFLRNNSGLEELIISQVNNREEMSYSPSADPFRALLDEPLRIANATALQRLIICQPIPLISIAAPEMRPTPFPLRKRFPRLKHLELRCDQTSWASSIVPNTGAPMDTLLRSLKGLETIRCTTSADLRSVHVPRSVTRLEAVHSTSDNVNLSIPMRALVRKCDKLRHVKLTGNGSPFMMAPNISTINVLPTLNQGSVAKEEQLEVPWETLTLQFPNGRPLEDIRRLVAPNLFSLVLNCGISAKTLLEVVGNLPPQLQSFSIHEPSENFFSSYEMVALTPALVRSLPPSLTYLRFGVSMQCDPFDNSFNMFKLLPSRLQTLDMSMVLPFYDWPSLPIHLESVTMEPTNFSSPPPFAAAGGALAPSLSLLSHLPCTKLRYWKSSLALPPESIQYLPSSLISFTSAIVGPWHLDHLCEMAKQLPLAHVVLNNGTVTLLDRFDEGIEEVNLASFVTSKLGSNAFHRLRFNWTVLTEGVPSTFSVEHRFQPLRLPQSTKSAIFDFSACDPKAHSQPSLLAAALSSLHRAHTPLYSNGTTFRTPKKTTTGAMHLPSLLTTPILSSLPHLTSLSIYNVVDNYSMGACEPFPLSLLAITLPELKILKLCVGFSIDAFAPRFLPPKLEHCEILVAPDAVPSQSATFKGISAPYVTPVTPFVPPPSDLRIRPTTNLNLGSTSGSSTSLFNIPPTASSATSPTPTFGGASPAPTVKDTPKNQFSIPASTSGPLTSPFNSSPTATSATSSTPTFGGASAAPTFNSTQKSPFSGPAAIRPSTYLSNASPTTTSATSSIPTFGGTSPAPTFNGAPQNMFSSPALASGPSHSLFKTSPATSATTSTPTFGGTSHAPTFNGSPQSTFSITASASGLSTSLFNTSPTTTSATTSTSTFGGVSSAPTFNVTQTPIFSASAAPSVTFGPTTPPTSPRPMFAAQAPPFGAPQSQATAFNTMPSHFASGANSFSFTSQFSPTPANMTVGVVPQKTGPGGFSTNGSARLNTFPKDLTYLNIPQIVMTPHVAATLPQTLTHLTFRATNWNERAILWLRSQLPNLSYLSPGEVLMTGAILDDDIAHLDLTTLISTTNHLLGIEPILMKFSDPFTLPSNLKSFELTLPPDILKEMGTYTPPLYPSSQNLPSTVPRSVFSPTSHRTQEQKEELLALFTLHQSFTGTRQLQAIPPYLTRLHLHSPNLGALCVLDRNKTDSSHSGLSTDDRDFVPEFPSTLTYLHLSPVACSTRSPFRYLPASLTHLYLGFKGLVTCGSAYAAQIPPKLKTFIAPDLFLFPDSLYILPQTLEHVAFYGGLGWTDMHLATLQGRIRQNAKIALERVSLTGALLSPNLTELTSQKLKTDTENALGPNISCNWTIGPAPTFPTSLTRLDLTGPRILLSRPAAGLTSIPVSQPGMQYGGPQAPLLPESEADFNLAYLGRQLPRLTSLSLGLMNFQNHEISCLPASLTSLTIVCSALAPSEHFWGLLPRALRTLHISPNSSGGGIAFWQAPPAHMDALPPHIEEVYIPLLKLTDSAVANFPLSLTSVTVNSCASPDTILNQFPHLKLCQTAKLIPFLPSPFPTDSDEDSD